MTDDELIGYADLHCRTERALFHRDHVNRLLTLAGAAFRLGVDEWIAVHADVMLPILDKIKNRRGAPT